MREPPEHKRLGGQACPQAAGARRRKIRPLTIPIRTTTNSSETKQSLIRPYGTGLGSSTESGASEPVTEFHHGEDAERRCVGTTPIPGTRQRSEPPSHSSVTCFGFRLVRWPRGRSQVIPCDLYHTSPPPQYYLSHLPPLTA